MMQFDSYKLCFCYLVCVVQNSLVLLLIDSTQQAPTTGLQLELLWTITLRIPCQYVIIKPTLTVLQGTDLTVIGPTKSVYPISNRFVFMRVWNRIFKLLSCQSWILMLISSECSHLIESCVDMTRFALYTEESFLLHWSPPYQTVHMTQCAIQDVEFFLPKALKYSMEWTKDEWLHIVNVLIVTGEITTDAAKFWGDKLLYMCTRLNSWSSLNLSESWYGALLCYLTLQPMYETDLGTGYSSDAATFFGHPTLCLFLLM